MDELTCLLMDTAKHLKTSLTKTLKPYNLTCSQAIAMRALKNSSLSAKAIGGTCSMDKATLSAVLDKLIDHGYISSHQNENDRREKVYAITGKGEDILPEIDSIENSCTSHLIGVLDESDYRSLMDLLGKVRNSVEEKD